MSTIHPAAVAVLRLHHDKGTYKHIYRYQSAEEFLNVVNKIKRIQQPHAMHISSYNQTLRIMGKVIPQYTFDNTIFDPTVFSVCNGPFTIATAKEMVHLPVRAHRELCERLTRMPLLRGALSDDGLEMALWHFEKHCRLFGDPLWSKNLEHVCRIKIENTYWRTPPHPTATSRVEVTDGRAMRTLAIALRILVRPAYEAVTRNISHCCWSCEQPGAAVAACSRCDDILTLGLDGAIAMGLDAIVKIIHVYDRGRGDVERLKQCFVWRDGKPQQHSTFINEILTGPQVGEGIP